MPSYPKRLIEVDLPIKKISAHARREKSIRHGHISTLHIWWARRPLAACRAVICAALWPDPADELCPQAFRDAAATILADFAEQVRNDAQLAGLVANHWSRWSRTNEATFQNLKHPAAYADMRQALLDFIADFAHWDASTVPAFLNTARALTQAAHEALGGLPGTRPLVVDPFAGGGAIPLEALRVGADAFASDLNPVAVLLNKVVLEYIPTYGQYLADEVHKWGHWIKEQAEKELAKFYPQDSDRATPIAYLWARTIACEGPGCGTKVPLMRSLWLAKKSGRMIALRLIPNFNRKQIGFEIIQNGKVKDVGEGTVRRGSVTCPVCGFTTPVASVRRQLKEQRGGITDARLIAIVTTRSEQKGRFYRLPTKSDLEATHKAAEELENRKKRFTGSISLVPDELTEHYHTFVNRGPIYGMINWGDYFMPRQALMLITLARLVREVGERLEKEYDAGLATAVQTILAVAVDRAVEHNSSLCRWNPTAEKMQATFARQALPMVWDPCEANPFGGSVGSWTNVMECVLIPFETTLSLNWSGHAERATATAHLLPDDAASAFVTDPPYYYSVQYADLSDFFYVWLRRTLANRHPGLLETPLTPKDDEIIVQSPGHEFAAEGKNNSFYESRMKIAMMEGRRILNPEGVAIIVFAHTSTAGWEALLQAMVDAGWIITGSWPIDTEMATRVLAQGRSVLASSIHLVHL